MSSTLGRLFAIILVFCLPIGVRELWNEFYPYMVEDYPSTFVTTETHRTNKLLNDLKALSCNMESILQSMICRFQLENVAMI